MRAVLRASIGLSLLPAAAGMIAAAAQCLGEAALHPRSTSPFVAGMAAYAAGHWFLRPSRLYVLSHELTHALAAWMCGARVMGIAVGEGGGHVDVSRSNAWVSLAPYVVPLYALVVVAAYRVLLWGPLARVQAPWAGRAHAAFLALLGAALAFHIILTAEVLWSRRQPDLAHAGGALFSLPLIALANGLLVLVGLKLLFPEVVSLSESLGRAWRWCAGFWKGLWALLRMALAAAAPA